MCLEVFALIMTPVFKRLIFSPCIAKLETPTMTKVSTALLEEMETLQDSLSARCSALPGLMLATKAMLLEDNAVPHDCKVKEV